MVSRLLSLFNSLICWWPPWVNCWIACWPLQPWLALSFVSEKYFLTLKNYNEEVEEFLAIKDSQTIAPWKCILNPLLRSCHEYFSDMIVATFDTASKSRQTRHASESIWEATSNATISQGKRWLSVSMHVLTKLYTNTIFSRELPDFRTRCMPLVKPLECSTVYTNLWSFDSTHAL